MEYVGQRAEQSLGVAQTRVISSGSSESDVLSAAQEKVLPVWPGCRQCTGSLNCKLGYL